MADISRPSDMVLDVRQSYTSRKQTFKYLLISDVHFDNPKCDRALFFKHLDQAREAGAKVLIFGDLFCLMQGKYDPRSAKSSIRPEHLKNNYLDAVINDTAEKLEPYKDLFLTFSDGNHETSITKRLETSPLERLCDLLNGKGANIKHMPYMGFVRLFYRMGGGNGRTVNLFYSHGHWGGVISKGTQAAMRYSAMAPQADVIYSGHTHDRNLVEMMRYNVTQSGTANVRPQYYLKGGCYKEEFDTGSGWAVERIAMPKNLGGWWMDVTLTREGQELQFTLA